MIRTVSSLLLRQSGGGRTALTFRPSSLASCLLGGDPSQQQRSNHPGSSRIVLSPQLVALPFAMQHRNLWGFGGGNKKQQDPSSSSEAATATTDEVATNSNDAAAAAPATPTTNQSVEDTLNKLFEEQQQQEQQLAAEASGVASSSSTDAWYQTAETATAATAIDWTPHWYNFADQAVLMVNRMHDLLGVEYGYAIIATTIVLRFALFPLMVAAQRTTSRMGHLQPELNAMKDKYEKLGTPTRQEQMNFAKNMKALFARYEVKPSRAFIAPLVQMPIFIGMFFGLKKMPTIFPDTLSTGGMFWFTDLTVPDPTYILPIASAGTFFALIEIGKEQMLMSQRGPQGAIMLNFFRAMAVLSLPVCINFESSMLIYWVTNNTLTAAQSYTLKQTAVRHYFGIWDPPKPVPGRDDDPAQLASMQSMLKRLQGEPVTEGQRIQQHNEQMEAKRTSLRMKRMAKERRAKRGITGTQVR